MRVPLGLARDRLAAWARDDAAGSAVRVLNLAGPLGIGKSRLLRDVAPDATVLDGVDSQAAADAEGARVAATRTGRFVVAGRAPLRTRDGWARRPMTTLELAFWPAARIRALAASAGAGQLDAVVRLAGGVPLVADALCRALRAGTDPALTGALADAAVTVLLARLRTERPLPVAAALPVTATLDGADEDLLRMLVTLPTGDFDRLAGLSIVRPEVHGLTVAEPYRSLLDLAYRWRQPVTRRSLAARAASTRADQLADTTDGPLRARLADQVLYLSANRWVRGELFVDATAGLRVRQAVAADAPAMAHLVRGWALAEALDPRRADRMLDLWLDTPGHSFYVAVDGDERAYGMVNVTRLDSAGTGVLEPLLQQHTDAILDAGRHGLVTACMAVRPGQPQVGPLLMRQLLHSTVASGRVIMSSPWPPWQHAALRFGLRHLGDAREDTYRCGRPAALYARTFSPASLPAWLSRMQGTRPGEPDDHAVRLVRTALADLGPSARGREPGMPPAGALRDAIEALAVSDDPVDVEAGQVLMLYYVTRAGGHDRIARRLHLSRATYFRRLEHGIRRLAASLVG